jgi:hypothetical protein
VPSARISILGRLSIDREDHEIPPRGLPGRRAELVFAYLAAEHRRTVSRDELADALWPGVLPDTWAAALRGAITEVRRFLEDAGLDRSDVLAAGRGTTPAASSSTPHWTRSRPRGPWAPSANESGNRKRPHAERNSTR